MTMSPRGVLCVTPSTFLSPRGYFFCRPEATFFVAPRLLFLSPRGVSEGSLGACAPREDTVGGCCPEHFLCRPEHFFVTPSASEGSLGACAPRENTVVNVTPSEARGPSPWGRCPERSVLWDAVPNEVSYGTPFRTKCLMGRRPERSEGCLAIARHDKKWGFGRIKIGGSAGHGWRGRTGCGDFSLRSKRQRGAGTPSTFLSPRGVSRGVPRHWRASGRHGGKCHPERKRGVSSFHAKRRFFAPFRMTKRRGTTKRRETTKTRGMTKTRGTTFKTKYKAP